MHLTLSENTATQWIREHLVLVLSTVFTVIFFVRALHYSGFSDGDTPVFDEKHYAPQAYDMLFNGGLEDNPSYGLTVHPPLGKMLISIGEKIFGYIPLGWRFTAILAGTAVFALTLFIIYKLTHSYLALCITALILYTDGILAVMGRVGMLDIFLALFLMLIATCIVMDHQQNNAHTPLYQRYWLFGAGIFSGCAMAVKFTGVYYPALLGIIFVITAIVTQRAWKPILKSLGMGLVFFLGIPLTVFFLTYTPWFAHESSVYRRSANYVTGTETHLPAWLSNHIPDSIESFLAYLTGVVHFHTGLTTSSGNLHPWESKPWQWVTGGRPMLFETHNVTGDVYSQIWLVGNPAVWFIAIPVIMYLAIRSVKSGFAYRFILLGILINWLPWFISYDRQMYLFYVTTLIPFVAMGIALTLRDITMKLNTVIPNAVGKIRIGAIYMPVIIYAIFLIFFYVTYHAWLFGGELTPDASHTRELFDWWSSTTTNAPTDE